MGVPVFTSSQISITDTTGTDAATSWLGIFDPSQVVVGNRMQTEILVDPYTYASYFQIQVIAACRVGGVGVLNGNAVQIIAGIKTV